MTYRYAVERPDYSDLASGRVLLSAPGHPAFPVRLASEVFQRCLAWRAAAGLRAPSVLYDPCCGAGYTLTVLGFLHRPALSAIIGSDIDAPALALARQNLGLLSPAGLNARLQALADLAERFGKPSHHAALASAQRLSQTLAGWPAAPPLHTHLFPADALDASALSRGLNGAVPDIVLVDVPYGLHSHWRLAAPAAVEPAWGLLEALATVLSPASLVAVVSDKAQKAAHAAYRRLERFQIGKRRIIICALADRSPFGG